MECDELMRGFAAKAGLQEIKVEDGAAAVEIDGIQVSFLHDESDDAVTIYGEIGFPPPEANGPFGEVMLKANHLFNGTDGAVLCQNPETFAYVLFRKVSLLATDVETFCAQVGRLVDQVEGWKRMLEGFRDVAEAAEDAVEDTAAFDNISDSDSFMRV